MAVNKTATANAAAPAAAKKEQYVEIIIPRPENVTGDSETTVSVNGKLYQIMYDRPVSVPVSVAEIINQSKALQAEIAKISAQASMRPGKNAIAEL